MAQHIVLCKKNIYALCFAVRVAKMVYQDQKAVIHQSTISHSDTCTYGGGVFVVALGVEVRWQGTDHHGNKFVEMQIRFTSNVSKGDDGEVNVSVEGKSVQILQKKGRLRGESRSQLKELRLQPIPKFSK